MRNTALKSVPGINFRESIRILLESEQEQQIMTSIFMKTNNKGFINIAGMQSPGLSSVRAICSDILKMLENSDLH